MMKRLRSPLAVILFLSLAFQCHETNAWNFSSMWPKVCAIGRRLVRSPYFVPAVALATVLAAGYVGYKTEPGGRQLAPVPDRVAPQVGPAPREDRGLIARFTREGYLRREQIQLGEGRNVPGTGILVPNARGDGQVRVQQAVVLDQFGDHGGGDASCGYHALKNACGIASTLLGTDRREWLTSHETVHQLFGFPRRGAPAGRWRAGIIREREKEVLKTDIIRAVFSFNEVGEVDAEQFNSAKIRGLYQTLRNQYVAEIVDRLLEPDAAPVDITVDNFVAWVQARVLPIANPDEYKEHCTLELIAEHVQNRATILAYIGIRPDRPIGYRRRRYNGELLNDGEIQRLIADVKREQEPRLAEVPMHVFDDIAPQFLEGNEDVVAIRRAIEAGQALPHQVYAFVLGTMRHVGDGGRPGHWMTLVLDTLDRNQRRYTLADSADNAIRLYQGPCRPFIRFLEGDQVAERLVLPDAHRDPGVTGWLAHTWRQFDNLLNEE